MNSKTCFLFLFGFLISLIACDNAELPPSETPEFCEDIEVPFYNTNVGVILLESCAYVGCHVDNAVTPSTNFDTYDGIADYLSIDLNMSTFRSRVLEDLKDNPLLGMPPDASQYPNSKKDDLTQEELEIMECWLDGGFLEE